MNKRDKQFQERERERKIIAARLTEGSVNNDLNWRNPDNWQEIYALYGPGAM